MISTLRWHPKAVLLHVRSGIRCGAGALLWIVALDLYWFMEECKDYLRYRDVWQVRVYGIPLYEWSREYGVLHKIASDLGSPCAHLNPSRTHAQRMWGLVYPCPGNPGMRLVGDDDWYDEPLAQVVRAKAQSSPTLPDDFRREILVQHNWQYIRPFLAELRQSRAGRTDQPQDLVQADREHPELPTSTAR